jgi:arginine N-succinyltransferase
MPHKDSARAMEILSNEGFTYNNYVDIFDAGPLIQARLDKITTVKDCLKIEVGMIKDDVDNLVMVASNKGEFLMTLSYGAIESDKLSIDKNSANILNISPGDFVYVSMFKAKD